MTLSLPAPIAGYFSADASGDAGAVAAWFTQDAIVKDEGKEHRGLDAIRAWKANASHEYSYTTKPFAIEDEGDRLIVTSHVEGNFPGSPVDLRYFFVLRDEKIAALEILP